MSERRSDNSHDPLSRLARAIELASSATNAQVPDDLQELVEAVRADAEPALDEPPQRDDPLLGATLGDFKIEREIGRGGMGVVYEARQRSLDGRRVALKVLPASFASSPKRLARFQQEAQIGAKLRHPNLVAVYSVGSDRGLHFIAQELVEGGRTLADWIDAARERTDLPVEHYFAVARLFAKVAEALHAAHEAGVIHRDLKPSNILLADSDEPKIADFGLAKDRESLALSDTGETPGTPCYKSPEQVDPRGVELDARSDVFALGATLYEALTCARLFDGDSHEQISAKILRFDAPDPRRLRARIPRDLALVCLKALEKERARRYATARDFADDLRAFVEHRPITAREPTLAYRASRWARREPAKAALVAVLALGVPAITALAGYLLANRAVYAAGEDAQRAERIERALDAGFTSMLVGQFQTERPADALKDFERALAEDPDCLEAIVGSAVALQMQTRFADVVAYLDGQPTATKAIPALARLRADAARALAASDVDASTLPEPTSPLEWFAEGWRALTHGRVDGVPMYPQAVRAFGEAIFRSERKRLFHFASLAAASEQALDEEHATRAARALIEMWPNSAIAHWQAGAALAHWHSEDAVRVMRRAIELAPNLAQPHASLGSTLALAGAYEPALRELERAIELEPTFAQVHANLGGVLAKVGRAAEAERACRRAVELDPRSALAHYNLGLALQRLDRTEEALAVYRVADTLHPRDYATLTNIGGCLFDLGRASEAIAPLAAAVELAPTHLPALGNLAMAHHSLGEFASAAAGFQRFCELAPDDAQAWYGLADSRLNLGDVQGALEAARKCRALLPPEPDPEQLGQVDELIEQCEQRLAADQ